ncbi:universal stress protein [Haladaptatus sp. F3-133]|jgi:nucleotide-binding universal stress UspA family protein|uniref:Universal stress protein n=1 Tax=Halorutilus salinus TaxID=2487751 RepID=A0A9Q4C532_9EURY|nr:universal stress protein [Halorutilus salinus]MCX2819220.1 universal stress protein [Halorutilus salinus]
MRFVVAVDGSDESNDAVRHAASLAEPLGADIELVHAITPEIYTDEGQVLIEDMSDAEARAETVLGDSVDVAEETGLEAETESLYGDAAEEVVGYAEEVEADGIFVGHRGVSTEYEDVVGSVAQELVRKATVPVTVVR